MKIINCAVADDEPIARDGIREFIENTEFLRFRGFAKDAYTTSELLASTPVDLLFIDISMPGLSGIEFVKRYQGQKPLIVFVTAYPDFAIESYNLDSLDYLMKPVSYSRFRETAERALRTMNLIPSTDMRKDFFFVKCDGKLEKITIPDITCISSLQNYVKIHLSGGKSHIVHSTLKNIFSQLDTSKFVMVHKSYIVNIGYIDSISGNQINLSGFGHVPIGRLFKPNILPMLLS